MPRPRPHSLMPSFEIVGYQVTKRPGSLTRWDLRVGARNGDAITVDDVEISEAQAFIKCLERMLIHQAPDELAEGTLSFDEIRTSEGLPRQAGPPSIPDEPPADPIGAPHADPPSTGPQPAAAHEPHEPFATGGWVPPWASRQPTVLGSASCDYVLPGRLNPLSAAWREIRVKPWASLVKSKQYEFDQVPVGLATSAHVRPQVVHLAPGQGVLIECTCWPAAGGALADNPNCPMHHGTPTVYVFDVS